MFDYLFEHGYFHLANADWAGRQRLNHSTRHISLSQRLNSSISNFSDQRMHRMRINIMKNTKNITKRKRMTLATIRMVSNVP